MKRAFLAIAGMVMLFTGCNNKKTNDMNLNLTDEWDKVFPLSDTGKRYFCVIPVCDT